MPRFALAAVLAAFFVTACSTDGPLLSEPMAPAEINTRVAYLLDAEPRPLPTIKREGWDAWDARENTRRGRTASGALTYTRALYDPNKNTVILSPAANEGSLAHELAHVYTRSEDAAECVTEYYHSDLGSGFNQYPRGWCS